MVFTKANFLKKSKARFFIVNDDLYPGSLRRVLNNVEILGKSLKSLLSEIKNVSSSSLSSGIVSSLIGFCLGLVGLVDLVLDDDDDILQSLDG